MHISHRNGKYCMIHPTWEQFYQFSFQRRYLKKQRRVFTLKKYPIVWRGRGIHNNIASKHSCRITNCERQYRALLVYENEK